MKERTKERLWGWALVFSMIAAVLGTTAFALSFILPTILNSIILGPITLIIIAIFSICDFKYVKYASKRRDERRESEKIRRQELLDLRFESLYDEWCKALERKEGVDTKTAMKVAFDYGNFLAFAKLEDE